MMKYKKVIVCEIRGKKYFITYTATNALAAKSPQK